MAELHIWNCLLYDDSLNRSSVTSIHQLTQVLILRSIILGSLKRADLKTWHVIRALATSISKTYRKTHWKSFPLIFMAKLKENVVFIYKYGLFISILLRKLLKKRALNCVYLHIWRFLFWYSLKKISN